ncbi:hypothetical protein JW962_00250, partial [Candidatus Dojkabacteria bacterium]|nr:hypothetical protein [Candidatus Dojkabacteria bacterium]
VIEHFDSFVTSEPKIRNSFWDIFNLLKLSNMNPKLKVIISIVSIVATLGAGTGTIYASDSANPGDFLYGLDKTVESVQRTFTSSLVNKAELEMAIMDERILELEKLSEGDNSEAVSESISEVEAQQLRLQERFQEMNQLRIENKLQTQEQQQVMEKLQAKFQIHEETMNKIQIKLKSNGDNSNSEGLKQVQNKYSEETRNQIKNFEDETGVKIQETEQEHNKNDGTQYNQEQEKNQNQNNDSNNEQNVTDQGIQQQGNN